MGYYMCKKKYQDIYEDTNSSGNLYNHNIPCYIATKAKKIKF